MIYHSSLSIIYLSIYLSIIYLLSIYYLSLNHLSIYYLLSMDVSIHLLVTDYIAGILLSISQILTHLVPFYRRDNQGVESRGHFAEPRMV